MCLARTLALDPEVLLLLDVPTSALDGVSAAVIAELARDHVTRGGTVVLVSHDLSLRRSRERRLVRVFRRDRGRRGVPTSGGRDHRDRGRA